MTESMLRRKGGGAYYCEAALLIYPIYSDQESLIFRRGRSGLIIWEENFSSELAQPGEKSLSTGEKGGGMDAPVASDTTIRLLAGWHD